MAQALTGIGAIQRKRCEYVEALRTQRRALRAARTAGNRRWEALTIARIGELHDVLGDTESAWRDLAAAVRYFAETNDRLRLSAALTNLGKLHRRRGEYGLALTCHEHSYELHEEMGDELGKAKALVSLGVVYGSLGERDRALEFYERALAVQEKAAARSDVALTLRNLGSAYSKRGEFDRGIALIERGNALSRKIGDRPGLASGLYTLGFVRQVRGQYDQALAALEAALEIHESLGQRVDAAETLRWMGTVHWKRGDREEALEEMERARALAAECGAVGKEIHSLWSLARWRLELGEPAEAVRLAREGVEKLPRVLGHLGEERAAEYRGRWAGLVELGVRAGREIGDVSVVAFFLESGRAGALLESMGGRDALAGVSLPKEIRQLETDARARVFEARARLERAGRLGERKEIQAAREALDSAEEGFLTVVARLRRTAKQEAAVTYPSAAPLAEIRACLRDGETLVLYALVGEESVALVVTTEGGRIVSLGSTAEIEAAVADFSPHATEGELGARIEKLRAKLVATLGLDEGTKRLLVSPDGRLAYVPFALLAEGRDVAYVPSGTTLVLLRGEEQDRAEGVLALGDPENGATAEPDPVAALRGGFDLVRLPATREEAKAIGDTLLLGSEATEAGFARAVATRPRWRAVHFACHGLVDPDRPTLSALALAKDPANDGYLTCLEVIRSRIPADLVALSACETARGKAYRAEGIVGLTRAFMVAGSPRILCSLWKVDDAATRALMGRFYELWNPEEGEGLPAATALRRAQESVRSREEWRHPRYWAAWVLWGRPE
jgi:tetratricopeptide (TPR) repeat protein